MSLWLRWPPHSGSPPCGEALREGPQGESTCKARVNLSSPSGPLGPLALPWPSVVPCHGISWEPRSPGHRAAARGRRRYCSLACSQQPPEPAAHRPPRDPKKQHFSTRLYKKLPKKTECRPASRLQRSPCQRKSFELISGSTEKGPGVVAEA